MVFRFAQRAVCVCNYVVLGKVWVCPSLSQLWPFLLGDLTSCPQNCARILPACQASRLSGTPFRFFLQPETPWESVIPWALLCPQSDRQREGQKCNSLQYSCPCCVDCVVALGGHTSLVRKIPSKGEHNQCGTLGHSSYYLSRVFLQRYLEITALISSVSALQQPLAFQYIFSFDISEALFRVSPTPKWTVVSYTPKRCGNKQPCQLKWRLTSRISNEY